MTNDTKLEELSLDYDVIIRLKDEVEKLKKQVQSQSADLYFQEERLLKRCGTAEAKLKKTADELDRIAVSIGVTAEEEPIVGELQELANKLRNSNTKPILHSAKMDAE